jgi:UPF0176 protein
MALHNRVDRRVLQKRIQEDPTPRTTLSFYRYVIIDDPAAFRNDLYKAWEALGILGRIYVAREGINAQISIPTANLKSFREWLYADPRLKEMPLKFAVEDNGKSFFKLVLKVREKIVADGLDDRSFDVTNVGRHLDAAEFNEAMAQPGTVVVDMRNHYESEVGHFENAILPQSDTFREELPMVLDLLNDKKDNKILLYCTGGVRCEKASAFLKHHGFKDVNQLHGGIIDYVRQIKQQNLPSRFKGKNFVFDQRLGERVSDDIISDCHQCQKPCDTHVNCANPDCHLLFIQCSSCAEAFSGCCTPACKEYLGMDASERRKQNLSFPGSQAKNSHHSKIRPKLNTNFLNPGQGSLPDSRK